MSKDDNKKDKEKKIKENKDDALIKIYTKLDSPKLIRLILIGLLLTSIVFMPAFYLKGDNKKIDKPSKIENELPQKENFKPDNEDQATVEENKDNDNQESTGTDLGEIETGKIGQVIVDDLRSVNLNELKKVKDYLNVRANRTATVELINDAIDLKERYYSDLMDRKGSLDDAEYNRIENLIIASLAMSEEFLTAFDNPKTQANLRLVVEKYDKK